MSCLQKIRAVHNDLHTDNIAVLKTKKRTLYYLFEDKIYKLDTEYMIFIFDFDFLYCEELGYNKNLDTYDDIYIRNCFSEKNDLYTLLLYAYPSLLKGLNLNGELIYEKEHGVCCEIPEYMYIEIKNTEPYIVSNHGVNIYKLNYGLINKYFNQPEMTFLLVSLKRKRGKCYMVPFSPHEYRMTCIDSRYPTTSSLINYHMREFIVPSYPDNEVIFTLPKEKPHIIHIDKTIAERGRFVLEELGIKPRFPPQKTGYVKIRTKN